MRGQALPCMERATGVSRRIFPKKKKTLWGIWGNSPAATAPVSSPPHHPSGDCAHLISEGAETTGTTRGRVPSNWECAHPPGSAHISSRRRLRLQASPEGGCSSMGECAHLISEGAETTGTTWGRVPSNRECTYPPGSVRTSSQRELTLQASTGGGCPSTRECAHLISEGAETTGTTQGRVPSDQECAQ